MTPTNGSFSPKSVVNVTTPEGANAAARSDMLVELQGR